MTSMTAYIDENRAYLGNSLDVLETLTQAQFDKLESATRAMGNNDVGIDNALIKTHETLEDFENSRKSHWRECRKHRIENDAVFYSDVQMLKGMSRISEMAVVDLGDFRIVLK